MIVVALTFGLGNQMFQYAAGRATSLRRNDRLIIETSSIGAAVGGSPARRYGLDTFDLDIEHATWSDLQQRRQIPHIMFSVRENSIGFDERALIVLPKECDPVFLLGSWQSASYFRDCEAVIRRDFSFRVQDSWDVNLAHKISDVESVCIHVRRGDYLTSSLGSHLGFVGLEYYERAVAMISGVLENPQYFIFSDDIEWCKDNLKIAGRHSFVEHGRVAEECDKEHLYLMTKCKHFVISNSTFAWWGAWLSAAANKIVIAPKRWFVDETAGNAESMLPDTWIRL